MAQTMKKNILSDDDWGPNFNILKTQAWKIRDPAKLKHFIWQIISSSMAVNSRLTQRGINCGNFCQRCGVDEETINHVLLEYPPPLKICAMSPILVIRKSFPTTSFYMNIDFLLWIILIQIDQSFDTYCYLWLLLGVGIIYVPFRPVPSHFQF